MRSSLTQCDLLRVVWVSKLDVGCVVLILGSECGLKGSEGAQEAPTKGAGLWEGLDSAPHRNEEE